MITDKINILFTIWSGLVFTAATSALALRMPTPPLAERISTAETVFIGVVTNRVVMGDWVQAELRVEEPLVNAEKGKTVPVTWRLIMVGGTLVEEKVKGSAHIARLKRSGGQPLFDAAEGQRGIAILHDKHQGRYWLRADKFEPVKKLDKVKSLVTEANRDTGNPAK